MIMVKISIAAAFGLVASTIHATPILEKRIAQVITQSTTQWEAACVHLFSVYINRP